jgi:hypothetical protein
MKATLPSPLPGFDRKLLRAVERVVPCGEREEWLRSWHAELWHKRYGKGAAADLSIGLIRDAFWLRTDSWRRTFEGTALLCLASLLGLVGIAAAVGRVLNGSWYSLGLYLSGQLQCFLVAAVLVVFVTFATSSFRHGQQGSSNRATSLIRRQLFFAAKTLFLLLLVFLLSGDLCQPMHALWPNTATLTQIFLFVIFALVGQRWNFRDQEQRCKQCLRALATPARVGRPSRNLLEWNGTELVCKQGHGLLSVPEMETSWCRSSTWVGLDGRVNA